MAYNEPMHADELAAFLTEVLGDRVTLTDPPPDAPAGQRIVVAVPPIGDAARIPVTDVLWAEELITPTGSRAARLGLRRRHGEHPVIIATDDVVFSPADPADVVDGMPISPPA